MAETPYRLYEALGAIKGALCLCESLHASLRTFENILHDANNTLVDHIDENIEPKTED